MKKKRALSKKEEERAKKWALENDLNIEGAKYIGFCGWRSGGQLDVYIGKPKYTATARILLTKAKFKYLGIYRKNGEFNEKEDPKLSAEEKQCRKDLDKAVDEYILKSRKERSLRERSNLRGTFDGKKMRFY